VIVDGRSVKDKYQDAEENERTTINAFHYPDFAALKAHVLAFVMAYNPARHLKALRWRSHFKGI